MFSYLKLVYISLMHICVADGLHNGNTFFSEFVQLGNEGMNFDENFESITNASLMMCFKFCIDSNECTYIGFHEDANVCQLHRKNSTLIQESDTVWKNYFKVRDKNVYNEVDPMSGATVMQSSTHNNHSAELAIDGDFDTYLISCAHTLDASSYWILTFGMPTVVTSVEIYLRSDYVVRNSYKAVLISQTYDDALTNIGTECGRYTGPLIDKPPYRLLIKCSKPLYGNVLRISHLVETVMELCEVVVHTP